MTKEILIDYNSLIFLRKKLLYKHVLYNPLVNYKNNYLQLICNGHFENNSKKKDKYNLRQTKNTV